MALVHLTEEAKEDLRDLDGSARRLVLKALQKLETDPEKRGAPLGSTRHSNLTTFRKLVVGDRDYRIVYRVEADGAVTVVWVIAKRADDEVYDLAVARLKMHGPHQELAAGLLAVMDEVWQKPTKRRTH